ncbi:putative transcription factor C2H2 family [Helianthus annuus]|nr:putative transcription factor C2H2 family [Helianthus annuus]
MPIQNTHQPSLDGNGSNPALNFNSCVSIDMKKFSQSELYALSRSSSDGPDEVNDVVKNVDSNSRYTGSTAAVNTIPRRIYAFSYRRGYRRRVPDDVSDGDADVQVRENKLILNSLRRLVTDGEAYDSRGTAVPAYGSRASAATAYDSRGTAVPVVAVEENPSGVKKRKRKRKVKNESEYKGLDFVDVNGEMIDLKYLVCEADGVFEARLNRMTEGMAREDEFLGFLNGLDGRWGSTRRRRKYVDAALFVKALPVGWKVLLSLRPRVRQPSLYCRRFVSPSDEHFKSCKDVAFYLKSQFATNNANPAEVGLGSGALVHISSHPASKINLLESNSLHKVPTHNLIKCNICRDSFTSIDELESHMQNYHMINSQRLDMDALTRKRSVPHGLLLIREPKYPPSIIQNSVTQKTAVENKDTVTRRNELNNIPLNGEGTSNERKNSSEGKGNFKTRCVFCHVEFVHEPVDAETLATSSGFICSKCRDDTSGSLESGLSMWTQRVDN